ncbi:hypothetical protein H4Q26_018038, partial [Puccinia striiformis f. sp. tritici PST-130]
PPKPTHAVRLFPSRQSALPPQSEVPAATDWRIEPSQDSPDPNAGHSSIQRTGQAVVARGTGNGDKKKDRDGFDRALLYCQCWPLGQGPNQEQRLRPMPADGARISSKLSLPEATYPKCFEVVADKAAAQPAAVNNLIAYTSKGQFSNNTLNRLVVIWVLHSRVWAASVAHKLYLEQPIQVVKSIKEFDSMVLLISDVWTTKGSHKAFMGISCCYITKDWNSDHRLWE